MNRIGVNAPLLRAAYKREIESMVAEIARRLQAGESREALARWVSAERNRIINRIRSSSGMITRGIYEIRDWREYGVIGGLGGGVAGSYAGGKIADGLYYSDANTPADQIGRVTVEIPFNRLHTTPPAPLCVPHP